MLEPGIYYVESLEDFTNNYYEDIKNIVNGKIKINYYNRKKNCKIGFDELDKVVNDFSSISSLEFFVTNKKGKGEYKMLCYIIFGDDNNG